MSSTYAPMPISTLGDGAELKPGRFLLEAHCRSLLAESPARDLNRETGTSRFNISALDLARLISEPGEVINASFPRISALLTDAQLSVIEKRIDDLYSQLQQVSGILQGLITDFIPTTEDEATENSERKVPESQAETFPADTPTETPPADIDKGPEPLRAMAMAA